MTRPRTVALARLVSLAVAMGIGRFAFTPLLPAMLAERQLTLGGAAFLASSNYLGYVIGALVCAAQPWSRLWPGRAVQPEHAVRGALVAVCLLTAVMGLPAPGLWAATGCWRASPARWRSSTRRPGASNASRAPARPRWAR